MHHYSFTDLIQQHNHQFTFAPLVRFVGSPHVRYFQEFDGHSAVEAFEKVESLFKKRIRFVDGLLGPVDAASAVAEVVAVDEGDGDAGVENAESVDRIVPRKTSHFI